MNRPLSIVCQFGCGHKITGTFTDADLRELMGEHYQSVHAAELRELVNGHAESV
jgi:hypothetical protein